MDNISVNKINLRTFFAAFFGNLITNSETSNSTLSKELKESLGNVGKFESDHSSRVAGATVEVKKEDSQWIVKEDSFRKSPAPQKDETDLSKKTIAEKSIDEKS